MPMYIRHNYHATVQAVITIHKVSYITCRHSHQATVQAIFTTTLSHPLTAQEDTHESTISPCFHLGHTPPRNAHISRLLYLVYRACHNSRIRFAVRPVRLRRRSWLSPAQSTNAAQKEIP